MADSNKNGQLPPSRPVVRLEVRLGSKIGLDPKARVAIFEASNPVLLDTYQVGIPAAMLKAVVGQLIAQEAENEAKSRGAVTAPNLKIVRPT